MKKIGMLFYLSIILTINKVNSNWSYDEQVAETLSKILTTKNNDTKDLDEQLFIDTLENKIDQNIRNNLLNNKGTTLLFLAILTESFKVLKHLLNYPVIKNKLNESDPTLGTPLEAAIFIGNSDILSLLIDEGADIEFVSKHGHLRGGIPYLFSAITDDDPNLVKFFIDHKVDVSESFKGFSPLDFASASNTPNMSIIQLLVNAGAKLSKYKPNQITNKTVRDIITQKIKVPIDLTKPLSDLGPAAPFIERLIDIFKEIKKDTVQAETREKLENEAIDILTKIPNSSRTKVLNELGGIMLCSAAAGESLALVKKLLLYPEVKRVVNTVSPAGYAPLHATAENKKTDIAETLWENGAHSIDIETLAGNTPLSFAKAKNNTVMENWFLKKKATVDLQSLSNALAELKKMKPLA